MVDALYRDAGYDLGRRRGVDLAAAVPATGPAAAAVPARHRVGLRRVAPTCSAGWSRCISGQTLDDFIAERILGPLGMTDTRWWVDGRRRPTGWPRSTCRPGDRHALRRDAVGERALRGPTCLAGGGGLISTAADYHRFTQMLLREGELDGVRLLGRRTVRYMTRNHLPGGGDLAALLHRWVRRDHLRRRRLRAGLRGGPRPGRAAGARARVGSYYWGGAGQHRVLGRPGRGAHRDALHPAGAVEHLPARPQLRQLVAQAVLVALMRLTFALVRIVVVAVALWVATKVVPGIGISGSSTGLLMAELVGVAAIFVVVEEILKPVIKTLGCLLYAITLGLIGLVVNALLHYLVGWLAERLGLPFAVNGFWAAFWGAIVVAVVSAVLHLLIPNRLDAR